MKIFIAHAADAHRSYDMDAVGATEAEAVSALRAALLAERRRGHLNDYWTRALDGDWREDVSVTELEVGKAYLDLGAGGRAYPDHPDNTPCPGALCAFKSTGGHP